MYMVNQNEKPINEPEFLQVPNWTDFQHYGKHRNPPWIKFYNNLLADYSFNMLPDDTKSHVLMIWLLASKIDNKIPNNSEWVKSQIHACNDVCLETMIRAGFLEPYNGMQSLKERLRVSR